MSISPRALPILLRISLCSCSLKPAVESPRCADDHDSCASPDADGDPILLFQAPYPLDVFVPQAQNERLAQALKEAGADVTLLMLTAEQLAAHGCTGELDKGSHGADLCMLLSTKPALDGAVLKALGPR